MREKPAGTGDGNWNWGLGIRDWDAGLGRCATERNGVKKQHALERGAGGDAEGGHSPSAGRDL